MKTTNALALTGAVLLAALWSAPRVVAKPMDRPLVVAQAEKNDAKAQKQKKPQPQNAKKPQQQPRKPAAAQARPKPQAEPRATQAKPKPQPKATQAKPAPARPKAAQAEPRPAAKPQAQAQEQSQKPSADRQNREERQQQREERQQQRNERRGERRERNQDQQKPAAAQPKEQQKPSAAQQKQEQQKPAARQQKQEERKPAAAQQKEEQQRKPAAAQEKEQRKPAAAQQQKEPEQKPAAAQQKQEPQKPAAAQQKQEQPQAPAAVQRQQQQQPAARPSSEAAAQQAIKPRSADEFILRKGERRQRGIDEVRRERRETREGDRIIIHEGDRRIVKEDNRIIIRHREAERFAIGARDVDVRRRGGEITTIVERPNGMRIINVTDDDGHLIRRVRRDSRGREVVIIDNRYRGRRPDIFIDVRPPRFHGHRDRYIVEAWRVPPPRIYEVFTAQPIEPLEQRYTLAQVRYSEPLRQYMPRVDLEINFESGSWQLTPDQIAELSEIANGLNRAIDQNPDEVFLIEGYTDAVGSEEDNLSLSDRRAEAVAVALTQEFNVPPENLVTQGYGEENLKVDTQGSERANRRVSIRRITPLIDKVAGR